MSNNVEIRSTDVNFLHPIARAGFIGLASQLRKDYDDGTAPCEFRIFECYRTPARQEFVQRQGNSKATAFRSAHQYGLAVDFVPFEVGRGFFWPDASDARLNYLRRVASAHKFLNDIPWDRSHVEHPLWAAIKAAMLFWPKTASDKG